MNQDKDNKKINLKGLAIGNGLTDPLYQSDLADFYFQTGLGPQYNIQLSNEINIEKLVAMITLSFQLMNYREKTLQTLPMKTKSLSKNVKMGMSKRVEKLWT